MIGRDWLHVTQIALGVMASALLIGMYILPAPVSAVRRVEADRPNIHRTIYLVDVKYLSSERKEK